MVTSNNFRERKSRDMGKTGTTCGTCSDQTRKLRCKINKVQARLRVMEKKLVLLEQENAYLSLCVARYKLAIKRLWVLLQLLATLVIAAMLQYKLGHTYAVGFGIGTCLLQAFRYAYNRRKHSPQPVVARTFRFAKPEGELLERY